MGRRGSEAARQRPQVHRDAQARACCHAPMPPALPSAGVQPAAGRHGAPGSAGGGGRPAPRHGGCLTLSAGGALRGALLGGAVGCGPTAALPCPYSTAAAATCLLACRPLLHRRRLQVPREQALPLPHHCLHDQPAAHAAVRRGLGHALGCARARIALPLSSSPHQACPASPRRIIAPPLPSLSHLAWEHHPAPRLQAQPIRPRRRRAAGWHAGAAGRSSAGARALPAAITCRARGASLHAAVPLARAPACLAGSSEAAMNHICPRIDGNKLYLFSLVQPDPENLKREIEAFRVAAAGTGGCRLPQSHVFRRAPSGCTPSAAGPPCRPAFCTAVPIEEHTPHAMALPRPHADAPRFEVHRLLMADSGTLLLCSVDHTGHLAQVRCAVLRCAALLCNGICARPTVRAVPWYAIACCACRLSR